MINLAAAAVLVRELTEQQLDGASERAGPAPSGTAKRAAPRPPKRWSRRMRALPTQRPAPSRARS